MNIIIALTAVRKWMVMKMRIIDADALIRRLKDHADGKSDWYKSAIDTAVMIVEEAPTIQSDEPRLMTYDELATFDGAFLLESSAISQLDWVFFFDTDTKSDAIWVEDFDGERYVVYREDYGTYTRCWTSRPTDEQREAVKWE